jgi:CAAX protease family protein
VSALPPPPSDLPPLPPPPGGWTRPDERPKATWHWWEILLVGVGTLILGTIPAVAVYLAFGQTPTSTGRLDGVDFLANAVNQSVVVLLLVGYLTWRHPGWQRVVRFPSARKIPTEIGVGLACGVGMTLALGVLVTAVLQPIFRAATHRDVTPAEQIGSGIHGWEAVAFVVAVAIVAPVAEELFYRGLFYRALRDRHGFWVGAIGSGVLFAVSHTGEGDLAQILLLQIAIGLFGVALAAIYEWRGSLGANVAAHAAFNLVTVVTVLKVF